MATFDKVTLSGSTQGRGIKVVATATLGTTIHATGTSATVQDEVWLWAQNNHTADVLLTIELGGASSPDDLIQVTIPFKSGLVLVAPGLVLKGSGAADVDVTAFAAVANVISIFGFVNRITP